MNEISQEALSVVSKVTGIWLDSLGVNSGSMGNGSQSTSAPSPESLTERQLNVLRLMAEGKTNNQIAQDLILSESTIRQETVKIYRALGVHARSEAGKRAKHLGIIDRLAI
jgi:DNA-binding NarL/FixJ family response regulator